MLRGGSTVLAIAVAVAPGWASGQAPAATAIAEAPAAGPSAPPARHVVEVGPSPLYYRKRKDTLGWGYRVGLGASLSLASTVARPRSRFTLDVLPAFILGFARGRALGVMFEGGYSYTQGGTHLFVVGAGPALRNFGPTFGLGETGVMTAALIGHAVVGTTAGRTAVGGRASALFQVYLVGLEISYQYLAVGPQHGHELRLMIDLGTLATIRSGGARR